MPRRCWVWCGHGRGRPCHGGVGCGADMGEDAHVTVVLGVVRTWARTPMPPAWATGPVLHFAVEAPKPRVSCGLVGLRKLVSGNVTINIGEGGIDSHPVGRTILRHDVYKRVRR